MTKGQGRVLKGFRIFTHTELSHDRTRSVVANGREGNSVIVNPKEVEITPKLTDFRVLRLDLGRRVTLHHGSSGGIAARFRRFHRHE
jgi:hypothetical protein